jgi:hypothetical protein
MQNYYYSKSLLYLLPCIEVVDIHRVQSRPGTRSSRKEKRVNVGDILSREDHQRAYHHGGNDVNVYESDKLNCNCQREGKYSGY